mmetsp:Transcript_30210/g.22450  ORF Transcript_30210/g.22450 Transcript_30210/m.22450 type:complete len:91 (+) Transcript_30210:23-295(+)
MSNFNQNTFLSKSTKSKASPQKGYGKAKAKPPTPCTQNPEDILPMSRDEMIEALCQFDSDPKYGPCAGISRIHRWQNAKRLGLTPPPEVL